MSYSNKRRRRNSDNRIYQTEFGPLDGRTRRFVGYLIMGIFGLMALGVTSMWFTMDHGPLYDPISGLMIIGIVDLLLLGFPAIAFFGQIEDEQASPQPIPSHNYDNAPVLEPLYHQPSSAIYEDVPCENVGSEPFETAVEVEKHLQEERKGNYSYRGEMPRRKRRDENLGK